MFGWSLWFIVLVLSLPQYSSISTSHTTTQELRQYLTIHNKGVKRTISRAVDASLYDGASATSQFTSLFRLFKSQKKPNVGKS